LTAEPERVFSQGAVYVAAVRVFRELAHHEAEREVTRVAAVFLYLKPAREVCRYRCIGFEPAPVILEVRRLPVGLVGKEAVRVMRIAADAAAALQQGTQIGT